ncbi:MAG: DUF2092 domain-containing protein [Pseudolabrys sp.]
MSAIAGGIAASLALIWIGPASAQRAAPTIDKEAISIFEKMSAYVGSLPSFKLDVTSTFDMIAGAGQTVTIDGHGQYQVRRPDKLAVKIENDLFAHDYLYDGKTLTVVSPAENLFAQVPAKPTIREMLETASQDLGVILPLSDLFDLGTDTSPIKRVTAAYVIGKGDIDGVQTDHLAFRDENFDWEIWITPGDRPVPVKVIIIDLNQAERPRYTARIKWEALDNPSDDLFSFKPTADQKPIAFSRNTNAQGGRK